MIAADRAVVPLEAGQVFTAPLRGFFVTDARMKDILDQLESDRIALEKR